MIRNTLINVLIMLATACFAMLIITLRDNEHDRLVNELSACTTEQHCAIKRVELSAFESKWFSKYR